MKLKPKIILTSLLMLLCIVTAGAQSISVRVLAGDPISLGETFTIQYQLTNVRGDFNPPSVPGCQVMSVYSSGSSQSYTNINGKVSSSVTQNYNIDVVATTPGKYKLPSVRVGGVSSKPVSYTISNKRTAAAPSMPGFQTQPVSSPFGTTQIPRDGSIKLVATASNTSPYVQQGIIYTIKLYTREVGVQFPVGSPSFENCAYEQLDVPHTLAPGTLNGEDYFVADIYRLIVFPTKEGKCVIEGTDFVVPTDRGDVSVHLNDVTLNVRPLPGMADHSDINGVGSYSVTAKLMNSHFQRNEAGTLRVTVKGTGNPTFVSMPDLSTMLPPGLKILNTETSIDKKPSASGVEATVTFDCSIVAVKEGSYDLPPLTFTFFDPQKGEWYTRTTKALSLEVSQGSAMHTDDGELAFESAFSPLPQKAPSYSFLISSALYWIAYAVLFVLLAVAVVLYRKRLALLADPELLRLKKANAMARMRLRQAEKAMRKGDVDLFYTEILKALWGYLSDKLIMPTSELSRSNISAELKAVAVNEQLVTRTILFIDDCEFAKYGNSANADMRQTYREACDLLNALETSIKHPQNTTQQ